MIRHACWLALASACSRDVRLGTAFDAAIVSPADAPASVNPFTAGSYALTFLDPADVQCTGSLIGQEAQFATITRADLSLVDGDVVLATPAADVLSIAGSPITTAWNATNVSLVPGIDGLPASMWAALVEQTFGSGPNTTTRDLMLLALDSTTVTATTGIKGRGDRRLRPRRHERCLRGHVRRVARALSASPRPRSIS